MILHSEESYAVLREAKGEVQGNWQCVPSGVFYEGKLADVWNRARKSNAYSGIGAFSVDGFSELPVTSRESLKSDPLHYAAIQPGQAAKYYETTGTTGRPTPTPRLAQDVIWNTVSVAEAWRPLLDEDERVAILLPSDIVPVADLIVGVCEYLGLPHIRAYPFATGISDWDRLESMWQTFQPTTVFLAPGVALQYTRLLTQRGQLPDMSAPVRRLMLLGEVNTQAFRGRLGSWWEARAYDASYGSTETGTLAASCAEGNQHLLPATNYFELDTGSESGVVPLASQGQGRLIVTPLNSHSRPLLRLDTGDEVSVRNGCGCGSSAPIVVVHGRASDGLSIRGVPLSVRAVEEVVYGVTDATGYLMEMDEAGTYSRLLLERGVGWNRDDEPETSRRVQQTSRDGLGLEWDDVLFVNTLPANTKSGASQKSWKRSNVRFLEVA